LLDVEAIERATVAAVAPDEVHEIGGFLVGVDSGTLGRARSAAPLSHDVRPDPAVLDAIEAHYRDHGYPPIFRVADVPGLTGLRDELRRRGYTAENPTVVKVGEVSAMRSLPGEPAVIAAQPDAAWTAVFLGEGFDPVDGAHRIRNLSRAPEAVFASVREDGRACAVGAGGFGHGWLSIHGMRTDAARRGEGLAGRVLAALAAEAERRGLTRAFLQVQEPNAPARNLYRRAGFRWAWRYDYWTAPSV
jgi:N-acetylglutamate synthase